MIRALINTVVVSGVTCGALYVGMRAYSFDSRLWVRVSFLVDFLCVWGSSLIIWLNLAALELKAHEGDRLDVLLVVLWGVPPLATILRADSTIAARLGGPPRQDPPESALGFSRRAR